MLTWSIAVEHTPEVDKESRSNVTKGCCGQWFLPYNGLHAQCCLQLQCIRTSPPKIATAILAAHPKILKFCY